MQRDVWPLQHHQQLRFWACSRLSNRSSVTKPTRRRKMRSNRLHKDDATIVTGGGTVGLEVGMQAPDQPAHGLLSRAMPVGECAPAVRHAPGTARADRRRSVQHQRSATRHDAGSRARACCPPEPPVASCTGSWMTGQPAFSGRDDAKPGQMRLPCRLINEMRLIHFVQPDD